MPLKAQKSSFSKYLFSQNSELYSNPVSFANYLFACFPKRGTRSTSVRSRAKGTISLMLYLPVRRAHFRRCFPVDGPGFVPFWLDCPWPVGGNWDTILKR